MATNLIDKIWDLLFKPGEAEKYQENEQEYLEENGLLDCDPADIQEAVVMAYEKGPVNLGATTTVGGNQAVGGSSQSAGGGGGYAPSSPPPPPPLDPTLPPQQAIEQTINYYVTNNTETNVDDRDTYTDSSVNTNVVADEVDGLTIDVENDTTTASGDGAVAAGEDSDLDGVNTGERGSAIGGDNTGVVNTGDNEGIITDDGSVEGNAIGDGNTVISDSTNVATGSGDVNDDDLDVDVVSAGDVSLDGVAFGDDATIDQSVDNSVDYEDSFNTDNSIDYEDSFNTTNTDSFNTDASTTNTDSFNTDVTTENTDSFNTDASTNDSFNTDVSSDFSTNDSFNTDVSTEVVDDPADM
jgi:hypothetical protein